MSSAAAVGWEMLWVLRIAPWEFKLCTAPSSLPPEALATADIDWVATTAIATWCLVAGTLIAEYFQTRQKRLINSATKIVELSDRFESIGMRSKRQRFASFILDPDQSSTLEYEVPAFFETLGLLTHRRVLDRNMVWNEFSNWVLSYYEALRRPNDFFNIWRISDPVALEEFEWLYHTMLRVESKRTHFTHDRARPSELEVHEFLLGECDLDEVASPSRRIRVRAK